MNWRILLRQAARRVCSLALLNAGNNSDARMAIMAMTTSSSMSVKPRECGGGENSGERPRLAARCRRPNPPKRDVLHRAKPEHNWSADGPRPQQPGKHKGAWYDPDALPALPAAARRDVARSGAADDPHPQQPGTITAAVDRTRLCNRTCCESGRFALRNMRAAWRCSRSRQFIAPWIRAPGTPCPSMFMPAGTLFDPLQMMLLFARVFINHMFKAAPRL